MWAGGNDYRIISENKEESNKLKKEYWAVKKGDTLLLNGKTVMKTLWYAPVLYRSAQFLYFKGSVGFGKLDPGTSNVMPMGAIGGAIGGASSATARHDYLTFVASGKTVLLDKKGMKELLKDDEVLLNQFKEEKAPIDSELIIKYLRALDEKAGNGK